MNDIFSIFLSFLDLPENSSIENYTLYLEHGSNQVEDLLGENFTNPELTSRINNAIAIFSAHSYLLYSSMKQPNTMKVGDVTISNNINNQLSCASQIRSDIIKALRDYIVDSEFCFQGV